MTQNASAIIPVLLSGGSGSRLWPVSRERFPKQLLNLCGDRTMIQETALRVGSGFGFADPIVICNQEHRFAIAEQLQEVGIRPTDLVLEPFGRNTAPAAAVAARLAARRDPAALVLLLPADHVILAPEAFRAAIAIGARAAQAGKLVTFGIQPTSPETGYGYIEKGEPVAGADGAFTVSQFAEKPKLEVARAYLAGGRHLWNSGMFLFRADRFVAELERHAPDALRAADAAIAAARADLDFLRLDPDTFAQAPNISIDFAVMEKTDSAAIVPCDIGWTDVGAWSALWDIAGKDVAGNAVLGDAILVDSQNNLVRGEVGLTALVGVKDLVVITTDDAVLVADRARVQDVKTVVDRLKADGRTERLDHRRTYRPWGYSHLVHKGPGFEVLRLTIRPGHKISLQKHAHRAEHWIVVQGEAKVTLGEEKRVVRVNESVFIPAGVPHRLENDGQCDLCLIEVQTGERISADDIQRIEDHYGRA
ncbi:mannose-1-phosphate guanylyltransferase/mannose-6-phosphate isomerase [Niveispirillum lacus]|uniref:mannose-1-phosphate guanylyltransferase n=1 Tax=Niveispirillum lacus TaxID=1981099 RepID=A0A255Z200_9PROT|nr:mannose-1-phosphate guanylyltransferase/mannose-6-phosphate isomerase [Niveispirillum lacus]OYQ35506.1 mannose-1-phosphate guanylyltransferase/mannose-6-phosphate isomerase [Niveispirillum lacus]